LQAARAAVSDLRLARRRCVDNLRSAQEQIEKLRHDLWDNANLVPLISEFTVDPSSENEILSLRIDGEVPDVSDDVRMTTAEVVDHLERALGALAECVATLPPDDPTRERFESERQNDPDLKLIRELADLERVSIPIALVRHPVSWLALADLVPGATITYIEHGPLTAHAVIGRFNVPQLNFRRDMPRRFTGLICFREHPTRPFLELLESASTKVDDTLTALEET
jgi:hypothetical protein